MAETFTCPHCSATLKQGTTFCGSCGKKLEAPAKPGGGVPKKTMMGFDATMVSGAPPAANPAAPTPEAKPEAKSEVEADEGAGAGTPPAKKPAPLGGKTRLGLPGVGLPGVPATAPAAEPATSQPRQAAGPADGMAATMVSQAPPSPDPAPVAEQGVPARTMIGAAGMSVPVAPGPAQGSTPTPAAPSAASSEGAHTMLGLTGPGDATPSTTPEAPAPPAVGGAPGGGRTMLGGAGLPGEAAAPAAAAPSAPEQSGPATEPPPPPGGTEDEPLVGPGHRRKGAGLGTGIVAGALLVAAGAVGLMLTRGGGESQVKASVVGIDTGEAMLFEVPAAPPGSKIRFGGQDKELTAGRVTFPLAADSLRVGDNAVLADVLYPNGDVESARITLAVEHRVRVDTSALKSGKASLDVVVTALPGAKVSLDGEELKLDQGGRAVKTYDIDVVEGSKNGHVDHVVRYRIQPPSGEATVDELHTKVPVTVLQIDRPGMNLTTDKEVIEIAGGVANATKVTVDGEEVAVRSGRFLYRMALKEITDHKPRVVAHAAGRAPVGVTLRIRRVKDLKEAAAGFQADKGLSYARIAQNPSIYKGQKVALDGRVYNVKVAGGRSVLQMLVRDCPRGSRCSLWVTYPAATDFMVDSWVRVLGTIDGQQQFRSEANQVVTVPRVAATFLLPTRP